MIMDHRITSLRGNQRGLLVLDSKSGLMPYPRRDWPFQNGSQIDEPFCFNLRGVERDRGPIFNYARVYTYRHLINTVSKAIREMLDHMRDDQAQAHNGRGTDQTALLEFENNAQQTDLYCRLDKDEIWAYPEWSVGAVLRSQPCRLTKPACILRHLRKHFQCGNILERRLLLQP